jgi:hypothetical protein
MTIYKLKNKETPWGDYSDILVSGMTAHLGRENDLLQLERTGPYIPPLINSGLWDITVTDVTKEKLESSGLIGIAFKPVIKKHIVELDWISWDLRAEEPPSYPESGEPEDYILERTHSDFAALAMGNIWELIIPVTGTFDNAIFVGSATEADIFKADNKGYILLTETAKVWIEQNAGDWVTFEKLELL